MGTKDREDLKVIYREFAESPFPKLGYTVDGFPETDSVLAGLVDQALQGRNEAAGNGPTIAEDLAQKVVSVCRAHPESQDAVELKAYFERMKRVEAALRTL